jgi:hypothetical protein
MVVSWDVRIRYDAGDLVTNLIKSSISCLSFDCAKYCQFTRHVVGVDPSFGLVSEIEHRRSDSRIRYALPEATAARPDDRGTSPTFDACYRDFAGVERDTRLDRSDGLVRLGRGAVRSISLPRESVRPDCLLSETTEAL